MSLDVPLCDDYHVHSTFSDGVSTVRENVAAADERGIRRMCLCDHVRADTGWVADFAAAVAGARAASSADLLCGVETKILDIEGHLDLPEILPPLDVVLIADHQFPGRRGPVRPAEMRGLIEQGAAAPAAVVSQLVLATAAAMAQVPGCRPLLAHLFSVLPKMGLAETAVTDADLGLLAGQASDTGAILEVNEKWACPSPRTVAAFAAAGVPVVPSSDSHDCASIGVFSSVRQIIDSVAAGTAP